jgi:hypothetical protein
MKTVLPGPEAASPLIEQKPTAIWQKQTYLLSNFLLLRKIFQ